MNLHWQAQSHILSFDSDQLQGTLVADCGEDTSNNRHHIRNLIHKNTGTCVSPDNGMMASAGSFTLFRAYARNSWLTEIRATKPQVERKEDGCILTWHPTIRHQVKITAAFTLCSPNIIDLDLALEGYAHYPDYELLCSNYYADHMQGGLFVKQNPLSDNDTYEKIYITDNPAFHGMYNFFPRNEYAAHIMTDGRGQKGRWYWNVACGRPYAFPFGFATDNQVDVLFMGRPEDVSSVGVTYTADDDRYDGVARHHALYLSLFGRDLHPGDGWRTQLRLVVDQTMNASEALLASYTDFQACISEINRTFEVTPC